MEKKENKLKLEILKKTKKKEVKKERKKKT